KTMRWTHGGHSPTFFFMNMKLYFTPLACSMATRISLYEAGADADFVRAEGAELRAVNPLGLVPVLRTEEGDTLTENAAILQYVAARFPKADLAPTDTLGRARLDQWLSFIGTELHKGLFTPLLDKKAPDAVKSYALEKSESRLAWVSRHVEGREFLLDRFS